MKHHDIFFAFVVIPFCVLLGSWVFEASFAITLLVVIFGVIFGTVVGWKKLIPNDEDGSNHNFLHPKYEVMIYGLVFFITLIIIYKIPNIRAYGFF